MSGAEAWLLLERGRPLEALRHWRGQLLAEPERIALHLEAAAAGLDSDPLAEVRLQALQLLHQLQAGEPGATEQALLGQLLVSWGELSLSHAPAHAQQRFEAAWACGQDLALAQQLADLYARQGMSTGALAMGCLPRDDLAPWPEPSCAGLHCQPCQRAWRDQSTEDASEFRIQLLQAGRCWIERHPIFKETFGVGVADADGQLKSNLCRRYPWHWPQCQQQKENLANSLKQLHHHAPANHKRFKKPLLAVADLSAELYYHAQIDLLPRIGRAWKQLIHTWPQLHLWHNGGSNPWLHEAFSQLGIPPERQIDAHLHPHITAELLLVPEWNNPFGCCNASTMDWLRTFWLQQPNRTASEQSNSAPVFLPRPLHQRRPLLQNEQWSEHLHQRGWQTLRPGQAIVRQLQQINKADAVLGTHGGAMTNLFAGKQNADLTELVNPAYSPPYFISMVRERNMRHRSHQGNKTPAILQDLLYAGPLEWPIDLPVT